MAHCCDRPINIKKVTATAACQTLSLLGLNLVPGKAYRLLICIKGAVDVLVNYYLDYNGDAVAANYECVLIWHLYAKSPNTIETLALNSDWIEDNDGGSFNDTNMFFDVVIAPDGLIYIGGTFVGQHLNRFETGIIAQYHKNAVASITRIDFRADVAASIDVGSFMAVYDTEK